MKFSLAQEDLQIRLIFPPSWTVCHTIRSVLMLLDPYHPQGEIGDTRLSLGE